MTRLIATTAEARGAADGTLTEIRRALDPQPHASTTLVVWNTANKAFVPWDWLSGVGSYSGGRRTGEPILPPLGQPGAVIEVAEEYAREDCGAEDGERLIWRADRAAAWHECPSFLGKPFYMDADYKPDAEWQPADTTPPWAVRSRVRITAVRVERAGEIWEWVYGVENVL